MKTLTSEAQVELQELFEELRLVLINHDMQLRAKVAYWTGELKPKRVRRNILTGGEVTLDIPVEA